MKKCVILFVTLLLVCVIPTSSLISIYAYCEEENTTTDETNVVMEEENGTYSSRSTIIEGGGEINGELWYGIQLDTDDKPIITYDIDYTNSYLLEYLKPGDIVYERNAGVDVVDFLGHIAMVVEVVQGTPTQQGYVLMIESLPSLINNPYTGEPRDLGVCYSIMTPTRFDVKLVSIMRVKNATDTEIQEAINWAVSKLEREWRFPLNKYIDDTDEKKDWYCSELVWAAYCLQGIDLVENNILPVAPEDIYQSDEVVTILDYSSPTTFAENTATHHTFNCDGDTYTEEHEYKYSFIDNETHKISCFCGYYIEIAHNFVCDGMENSLHYVKCVDCGHRVNKIEDSQCTSINSTQHSATCPDCGYSSTSAHVWEYEVVDNEHHKKSCSECGYSVGNLIHTADPSYNDPKHKFSKCRYCNAIYPSTVITPIIKNKIKIEEETE